MNRRDFLVGAGALTALAPFITMDAASAVGKRPVIVLLLLRGSLPRARLIS
jgi:uncharacterized protein (DUF1501 family)